MKIEIFNHLTGALIYLFDAPENVAAMPPSTRLGLAVKAAIGASISLAGAYLRGVSLADAYLRGANMADAEPPSKGKNQ